MSARNDGENGLSSVERRWARRLAGSDYGLWRPAGEISWRLHRLGVKRRGQATIVALSAIANIKHVQNNTAQKQQITREEAIRLDPRCLRLGTSARLVLAWQ